jgi:hypothetical protein
MININNYIKNENTLNIINPYKIIDDFNEVDIMVCNILDDKKIPNLIFSNLELKNYFYSKLEDYNIKYNYINCNSSIERFFNDIQNDGLILFNNINNCKDPDIIKIIKNTDGIIIC